MAISTFEIKICGQKLCSQKDGFCNFGHIFMSFGSLSPGHKNEPD